MLKRTAPVLALALCLLLSACSVGTSKSLTWSVDTGDKVTVKVDTSEGYDIAKELPLTISRDGETVLTGGFTSLDVYEECLSAFAAEPTATLIEDGTKDGNEYVAYSISDNVDFVMKIGNSNTAVLLAGNASDATDAFDALTFSVED